MGVGGQVFDLKGSVVLGQQIQLGGVLAGTPIPAGYPTLTGVLPYAPGYYEFTLGNQSERLDRKAMGAAGRPGRPAHVGQGHF